MWRVSVAAQQRIVALSCVRAARVEDGERSVFSGSRAHLASWVVCRRGRERQKSEAEERGRLLSWKTLKRGFCAPRVNPEWPLASGDGRSAH